MIGDESRSDRETTPRRAPSTIGRIHTLNRPIPRTARLGHLQTATTRPRQLGFVEGGILTDEIQTLIRAAAPPASFDAALDQRIDADSILVVGGTGFVGRQLVERLSLAQRRVRVLTRMAVSQDAAPSGEGIEVVQGDYRNPAAVEQAMEGVAAVYHLAKGTARNWQEALETDIEPTRQLAAAAVRQGVRRFVYVGSIDGYASARAGDTITHATPLDPRIDRRNLYARTKVACERVLLAMARDHGLPLVILRPGIVIGAGSSPIHYGVGCFADWDRLTYWGAGKNPLPFVLVEDVVDALVRALTVADIEGRSFLITDAPLLSARDYVAAMQTRTKGAVQAAPRAIWRYWIEDLVRELVKAAIRHPNRRRPSLHDWQCRAHRATYGAQGSVEALGWRPAGTRAALIERGIYPSVDAAVAARTAILAAVPS